MTCIVAAKDKNGDIWMGGDSMVSGYLADVLRTPKVVRTGDWLLGIAGDLRDGQIIAHGFVPPDVPSGMSDDVYMTTIFTVAMRTLLEKHGRLTKENSKESSELYLLAAGRGKIWMICSDFGVARSRSPFIAVGSGSDFALGALQVTPDIEPRKRILAALRASERWCETVRRPFIVKKI